MRHLLTIVIMGAVAGCASSQEAYSPGSSSTFKNEKLVQRPFEKVWDQYVAELTKSFFVINNISKESRIINVSFSSNTPGEYIDCGSTSRTTTHLRIGTRTYNYEVANSSTFMYANAENRELWDMNRRTRLEGRANAYLAPEGNGTLIRINAKYVWTEHINGQSSFGNSHNYSYTIDLSTNDTGSYTHDSGTVTCASKGALERQLLSLI